MKLTVTAGEPGATLAVRGSNGFPTGFPICTADLGAQTVTCGGLNDANTYSVTDGAHNVTGLTSSGGELSTPLHASTAAMW